MQFQINFIFIYNDGLYFFTMYHNFGNYNVHVRFAHLHYELQFSCPIILKLIATQLHWTPYN